MKFTGILLLLCSWMLLVCTHKYHKTCRTNNQPLCLFFTTFDFVFKILAKYDDFGWT